VIHSIEIQNYKSVLGRGPSGDGEPTVLCLEDDITTLLGKNEAGKSNILAAINRFGDKQPVTQEELSKYDLSAGESNYEDFDTVKLLSVRLNSGVKNRSDNQVRSIPWLLGPYEVEDINGIPIIEEFSDIPSIFPSEGELESGHLGLSKAIKRGNVVIHHFASGKHTIEVIDSERSPTSEETESLLAAYDSALHLEEFIDYRYHEHLRLCWWFIINAAEVAAKFLPEVNIDTDEVESADRSSEISDLIKYKLENIHSTFQTADEPEESVIELTGEYESDPPNFLEISKSADQLLKRLTGLENPTPYSDLPRILDQSRIRLAESRYDLWEDSDSMVVKGLCSRGAIDLADYSAYNSDRLKEALDQAVEEITTSLNAFWDLNPTERKEIETLTPYETERYEFNYELDGREIELTLKEGDEPATPISQRSDGMRWIITFLLSVIAQPYEQSGGRETLVTLDDPGIHLHPEAEKLLFRAFFYVTTQAQITYTTHSPALIDRKEIDRLRIIDRETDESSCGKFGTTISNDIDDAKSEEEQVDPLSTAREAVGWQLSDSLFQGEETILVEGPSDKKYLQTFHEYLKWDEEKEQILGDPTFVNSGGDQLPFLSRILAAEDVNHVISMDDDKLQKDYDEELEERIVYYNDIELAGREALDTVEIEDLFNPDLIIEHAATYHEFHPADVRDAYPDDGRAPIEKIIECFIDEEHPELAKKQMSDDISSVMEDKLRSDPDDVSETIARFRAVLEKLHEELQASSEESASTE